jgi:phenylalanyl-tRNA synthetase beta subunit
MEKTADITEEIARLYGFDNIPATEFSGSIEEGGKGPVLCSCRG